MKITCDLGIEQTVCCAFERLADGSIRVIAEAYGDDIQEFLKHLEEYKAKHQSPGQAVALTTTLDCDHCGSSAIESKTGMFWDGDGGHCANCGHPGHVMCDGEEIPYWHTDDGEDDVCCDPDCEECNV